MKRRARWDSVRYTLRQLVVAVGVTAIITGLLQTVVWMACKLAEV